MQIDRDIRHVVFDESLGRLRRAVGHTSAPAEPDAAAALERRTNSNLQPAGARAAIRYANPVGNYDEPRQYRSPQLRDNFIALMIKPAIE